MVNADADGLPSVDLVANIGQRMLGRIIDWIIVGSVMVVFAGSVSSSDDGDIVLPWWLVLVMAAVFVAYETVAVARYGRTVGKMFTRTIVVSAADGSRPAVIQALLRALAPGVGFVVVPLFGGIVAALIYLTALADRELRQGIPDRLAGTAVVQERSVS